MQNIYIEREENIFYCPFCGNQILKQPDEKKHTDQDVYNVCEHLLFIALDTDEPFEYCREEIKEFYSQLEDELIETDEGSPTINEFLCGVNSEQSIDKLEIPNAFCLVISSGIFGDPCLYLGFKY